MIKSLSRRTFLATASGSLTAPALARAATFDIDVAIVGAGSAGLAAGHTLVAAGYKVAILEASNRIGGRAFTDTTTFGLPFDRGCSWLHSADVNPYTPMAREWGYTLKNHDNPGEAMFVGNREPTTSERSAYDLAWRATLDGLLAAGQQGLDAPASDVVLKDMPWSGVSQTWLGPLSMGVDFADMSPADWWSLAQVEPNVLVMEGFGTVVARYGADLPITFNAPVTAIDHGSNPVRVESAAGTVTARAAIVTVSTGVLAAEKIRFTPGLPNRTLTGIDGLPMGLLAKVPFLFDGTRLGLKAQEWLAYKVPEIMPAQACYFLTWPFDTKLMIGFIGGSFGWELSAAGHDAAVDFARGELRAMFGADVDKHIIKGDFTDWANDPWVLGGYAAERPGQHGARAALAEPISERLFLAGEALAGAYAMTCGGANMSGSKVARNVIQALR